MPLRIFWLSMVIALGAGAAFGQGPRVAIRSQAVRAEIDGRLATTTLEQVWVNYTEQQAEAIFTFRLPPDAAVHDLAMWVGGLRSPAEVHPASLSGGEAA